MIPKGQTPDGGVALRKQIHDYLRSNSYRSFRVKEIADALGVRESKRVSAALLLLVNDQKIAMNYPHIHRADHGTYIYNSQKPQVFRQRAKTVKPAKKTVAQPVAQPMTGNFTELTDSIVLRHKSGKLYIARPVN